MSEIRINTDSYERKYGKPAGHDFWTFKIVAPSMACKVLDWAIQAHGAAGVTDDFGLAMTYVTARTLRIVDGPDAVHEEAVARLELRKYEDRSQKKK